MPARISSRRRARRARPALFLSAAALTAAVAAPVAAADQVSGLRSEALAEKSHLIELRLDRGHAELVVRRTVFNGGARHDQATFMIDVPQGAVATGLASLGVKDGQPFWFRGDLMEAEAAAQKYRELTGIGGYYPKDPALLSWRTQTLLALQVFPCAPAQPKTIEYTLKIPTHYSEGQHRLELPRMGTPDLAPLVALQPARAGDRLLVNGKPVEPGATITLAADQTEIALVPRPTLEIDGAFAAVPVGKERALVQFHVDLPARLSEVPRNARVVVILDRSRSLDADDAAAGIAAVRSYLGHMPDALVEVLTFDREVRPRHGRFVSAAAAAADLARVDPTLRNGSRVDDALARADALLASFPASLPRRILVLTDLLTRSALTPDKVGALVKKSGALVHVGIAGEGVPEVSRDDEHAWAPPIRATGGLVWRASASRDAADAADMRRVYEEWARPVRLDKVAVQAKGFIVPDATFEEMLPEGAGIEHLDIVAPDGSISEVEVTGELWARPAKKVLRPSDGYGKLWSALVFGSEQLGSLSEEEMMPLAMRGGAVSPVTSYLAIEPGVRPSTEGLEWGTGEGGGGFGEGIGLGSIGTIGWGRGTGFDPLAYLREKLGDAFRACPAGAKAADITLETTLDEVVDVPAIKLDGAADAAVSRCLEEAAWALALPGSFGVPWNSYEVRVTR